MESSVEITNLLDPVRKKEKREKRERKGEELILPLSSSFILFLPLRLPFCCDAQVKFFCVGFLSFEDTYRSGSPLDDSSSACGNEKEKGGRERERSDEGRRYL